MPESSPTPPPLTRLLATLVSPLQHLRKFGTQRIENELRHEISALRHALDTLQKSSHEKIRALEIIAAGSRPWQTSAPTANTSPYFTIILPTRNRAALTAATQSRHDARWRAMEIRSIDGAFLEHADDVVLQPLHDCWLELQHESASAAHAQIA